MTVLVNYDKLWIGGGYAKENSLENSLRYLEAEANKRRIPKEVMDLAVSEIFLEVARGKQYPLDKCPCGCGIDKSGTAITHAMLARMLSIEQKTLQELKKRIEERSNTAILRHIERLNEAYVSQNLRPNPIVRASRAVANGLKRFFTWRPE